MQHAVILEAGSLYQRHGECRAHHFVRRGASQQRPRRLQFAASVRQRRQVREQLGAVTAGPDRKTTVRLRQRHRAEVAKAEPWLRRSGGRGDAAQAEEIRRRRHLGDGKSRISQGASASLAGSPRPVSSTANGSDSSGPDGATTSALAPASRGAIGASTASYIGVRRLGVELRQARGSRFDAGAHAANQVPNRRRANAQRRRVDLSVAQREYPAAVTGQRDRRRTPRPAATPPAARRPARPPAPVARSSEQRPARRRRNRSSA